MAKKNSDLKNKIRLIGLGIIFIVIIGITSVILQGTDNIDKTKQIKEGIDLAQTEYTQDCSWKPQKNYGPCGNYLASYYNGSTCVELMGCNTADALPFESKNECSEACVIIEDEEEDDLIEDAESVSDAEGCDDVDGIWKVWGTRDNPSCNIPTDDANNQCSDSTDCESFCVIDSQATGFPLEGRCYPWNIAHECITLIENGELGESRCYQ